MKKLALISGVLLGLMLAIGSPARADSISFDLSTIANDLPGGPLVGGTVPPAYLVTVTVTTGVANGSATAISGLNVSCPGGAANCFQVDFHPAAGSSLTYVPDPVFINVKGTFAAKGNDGIPSGPGGFDSFGTFSVGSGAAKPADVYFWLVPTGGNSWASAADVLTPTTNFDQSKYSQGFMAGDGFFKIAIDQDGAGPNPSSTDAQQAGYFTPVPEPATMILLGSGLIALAGYGRKKFLRK